MENNSYRIDLSNFDRTAKTKVTQSILNDVNEYFKWAESHSCKKTFALVCLKDSPDNNTIKMIADGDMHYTLNAAVDLTLKLIDCVSKNGNDKANLMFNLSAAIYNEAIRCIRKDEE